MACSNDTKVGFGALFAGCIISLVNIFLYYANSSNEIMRVLSICVVIFFLFHGSALLVSNLCSVLCCRSCKGSYDLEIPDSNDNYCEIKRDNTTVLKY